MVIRSRITSGDIVFEGKGLQIDDDLFHVAGWANWLLRRVSNKNFGYISFNATPQDRQLLQQKWVDWQSGKKVKPYINPYPLAYDVGISDISHPEALEALIYALKPNQQKT